MAEISSRVQFCRGALAATASRKMSLASASRGGVGLPSGGGTRSWMAVGESTRLAAEKALTEGEKAKTGRRNFDPRTGTLMVTGGQRLALRCVVDAVSTETVAQHRICLEPTAAIFSIAIAERGSRGVVTKQEPANGNHVGARGPAFDTLWGGGKVSLQLGSRRERRRSRFPCIHRLAYLGR